MAVPAAFTFRHTAIILPEPGKVRGWRYADGAVQIVITGENEQASIQLPLEIAQKVCDELNRQVRR